MREVADVNRRFPENYFERLRTLAIGARNPVIAKLNTVETDAIERSQHHGIRGTAVKTKMYKAARVQH
jgi:hypothetical protein